MPFAFFAELRAATTSSSMTGMGKNHARYLGFGFDVSMFRLVQVLAVSCLIFALLKALSQLAIHGGYDRQSVLLILALRSADSTRSGNRQSKGRLQGFEAKMPTEALLQISCISCFWLVETASGWIAGK